MKSIPFVLLFSLVVCAIAPAATLEEQLVESASTNSLQEVEALLTKGANTNQRYGGTTALHLAAEWGHHEVANRLLKSGANPDVTDSYGRTAVMWAAANGHTEIVKLLVMAHSEVNRRDDAGASALDYAAQSDDFDLVKLLLNAGAKPAADDAKPLRYAISNNNEEMVWLLLERGANPCAEMPGEMNAYLAAGWEGALPVAKVVIDAVDRCAEPAKLLFGTLNDAAQQGKLAIVEYVMGALRQSRYRDPARPPFGS